MRRFLFLILMTWIWCGASGCVAFYGYGTQRMHVVDAETGAAIEGVTMSAWYPQMLLLNPPKTEPKKTDSSGKADLWVATFNPCELGAMKEGYLPLNYFYIERDRSVQEVRLYKSPGAKIKIILPEGYRGVVAVEMLPQQSWVQEEIGKRAFEYRTTGGGYVSISASPLFLRHYIELDTFAVYAESGLRAPLRYVAMDSTPRGPQKRLYWVGTLEEADELTKRVHPLQPENENTRSFDSAEFEKVVNEAKDVKR